MHTFETDSNPGNDDRIKKAPYANLNELYLMHFLFAFSSRMWSFASVLFISMLTHNSLFFVALSGFASSISIFLFSPMIGEWLDETDRMEAVSITLVVKGLSVLLGYSIFGILIALEGDDDEDNEVTIEEDSQPYFNVLYILPLINAIASLSFSTIPLCIEKDWIVELSNGDQKWLTSANAFLTQIDLMCLSTAPVVAGFIFTMLSPSMVSVVILAFSSFSIVMIYIFLRHIYNSWPSLSSRSGSGSGSEGTEEKRRFSNVPEQEAHAHI